MPAIMMTAPCTPGPAYENLHRSRQGRVEAPTNSIYASKPRTGLALRRHRKISPWIATCSVGFALHSRYVSRHPTVPPPGRTALATQLVLGVLRQLTVFSHPERDFSYFAPVTPSLAR